MPPQVNEKTKRKKRKTITGKKISPDFSLQKKNVMPVRMKIRTARIKNIT